MKYLNLFGAKGGVGTTTVGAAVAVELSKARSVTVRVSPWSHEQDAFSAVLGAGTTCSDGREIIPGLFYNEPQPGRATVTDFSTDLFRVRFLPTFENYNLLVVRNDYLGLRRALYNSDGRNKNDGVAHFDGFVLVEEPGRALGLREVRDVLGLPHVATIPVTPTIARAVDAGVLGTRLPQEIQRAARQIIAAVPNVVASIG